MSEQSLLLSLRNAVQESTDQFLMHAGKEQFVPHATSGLPDEEEMDALQACLLVMSLRMLEVADRLHILRARKEPIAQMSPASLHSLCVDLHDRLKDFASEASLHFNQPPTLNAIKNTSAGLKHYAADSLIELWRDETTLGYAYQFFCGQQRKSAKNSIQSANKALSLRDLVTFTQLYTPGWVVDYLLANSVYPLWTLADARDHSYDGRQYTATQLHVLDPACGCGHFLLRAFDMLLSFHASEGIETAAAIRHLLTSGLAGADIDCLALKVCNLSFLVKALKHLDSVDFKCRSLVNVHDALGHDGAVVMGSLAKGFAPDHILGTKYAAVVTNPPYIGRKLLSRQVRNELKVSYPECHHDLCAAFLKRGLELLRDEGGRLGVITQASLLSLPSYGKLRQYLLDACRLVSSVDLGAGVFPMQSGEKVNSVLLVAESVPKQAAAADKAITFVDLTASKDKCSDLELAVKSPNASGLRVYRRDAASFSSLPNQALNYSCPPAIILALTKLDSLQSIAEIRQGLATTDNKRFVRNFFEVEPDAIGKTWFHYVKGAGSERWYSPVKFVVLWADNGKAIKEAVSESYPYLKGKTGWVVKNEQFYFRRGLCFSFVNSDEFCVRQLPAGCIFDVAASAVFPEKQSDEDFLLAYLNSSFVRACAKTINPTINFQVGDIKRLPLIPFSQQERKKLSQLGRSCAQWKKDLVSHLESGLDLIAPSRLANLLLVPDPKQEAKDLLGAFEARQSDLLKAEKEINDLVLAAAKSALPMTDIEFREVEQWIADSNGARNNTIILTTKRIAQQALHVLISARLAQEDSIKVGDLGLSKDNTSWLEATLGANLSDFLSANFSRESVKSKAKAAPYIVQFDQGHEIVIRHATRQR
jgi:hypothetical protein